MATEYLLNPYITVTVADDGSIDVEFDDADTLTMRRLDGEEMFYDYTGGPDWDAIADQYVAWKTAHGVTG